MDTAAVFRVDGLVAVITGGGTGLGLMMAQALMGAGAARVYILGRRKDVLDQAAAQTKGLYPIECDIGSKESLQSAVDIVTKESGHINLLVANSGTTGPKGVDVSLSIKDLRKRLFEETPMKDFTSAYHINVTGSYYTALAFLELLDAGNKRAMNGGYGAPLRDDTEYPAIQSQVIFTTSVSAHVRGLVTSPAYGGSKAAVSQLTKLLSTQFAGYGIRFNAIAPGLFPSELSAGLIASRDAAKEPQTSPVWIPAGRYGGREEMGGTVVYLASRAGSYCNGLINVVDGGRLAIVLNSY